MNRLLILFLSLIVLYSCDKEDKPFMAGNSSSTNIGIPFTKAEKDSIFAGADDEMMRVFTINDINDSLILRKNCLNVIPDSTDLTLMYLIDRMYQTVNDPANPGVGIAAPQVGINRNIVWVMRYDKPGTPFEVYLNPVITEVSANTTGSNEGCLSIPGESHVIDRYRAIVVEYYGLDGEIYRDVVEGYTAKIFQHEIDHLSGVLYIDYM